MVEGCTGSQGSQQTVVLDKKTNFNAASQKNVTVSLPSQHHMRINL
jgi:hypothetical protein